MTILTPDAATAIWPAEPQVQFIEQHLSGDH
jgi:hypothetical protein